MKERTYQITQRFAKALWNVLKQHNEKLKVAEIENQILRENIRKEKEKSMEMEKELKSLRSCCTCSKDNSVASTVVQVVENFESIVFSEGQKFCEVDETKLDSDSSNHIISECSSCPRIFDSTPGEDQRNKKCSPEKGHPVPGQKQGMCSEALNQNIPSNLSGPECIDDNPEHEPKVRNSAADVSSPSICVSNENSQVCKIPESFPGTGNIHEDSSESNNLVVEHLDPNSHETVRLSDNESSISLQPCQQLGENNEDSLDLLVSHKHIEQPQQQDLVDDPKREVKPNTSSKKEKPKRRLLPKSSILVREISTYDADEIDKPRGNGGGKNLAASERQRTQGSISLLRLLKNNLHL